MEAPPPPVKPKRIMSPEALERLEAGRVKAAMTVLRKHRAKLRAQKKTATK